MSLEETYPSHLLYHPSHDWASVQGDLATFGITWFAQHELGDLVFWEPPRVGATLTIGEAYTEVESVKAVSDVIAPLSAEVLAINDDLNADPGMLNEDPYGMGWIVRVRLTAPSEIAQLLSADDYRRELVR